MDDSIRRVLEDDPRIAYAVLFGSHARDSVHSHSDVDIAIGITPDCRLDAMDVGTLIAKLESAVLRSVDLVVLNEAPPGLAYRIFRDGKPIFVRDRKAFTSRLAWAVLEYLDFQPIEELFARSVLARHGR
jgi:predicted nucleotidyltransferase